MGAINCKTNVRFTEEIKAEADISNPFDDEVHRVKSLYKSMASRVLSSREQLLQSYQTISRNNEKNFDPYYAFLLTQLQSTRIPSLSTASDINSQRNGKENMPTIRQVKKVTKPQTRGKSRSSNYSRRPGLTSLYLYVEAPTQGQGMISKGGKLKAIIPSSLRNSKPKQLCQTRTNDCTTDERPSFFNESQVTSSIVPKTEIKLTFDIISLLPHNVQVLVLSYLIDQYRQILCVSAVWHSMTLTTLDMLFNPLENQLIDKSNGIFNFRNSFTQSTVCKNGCWKGVRVDRIIQLELQKGFEGKTLGISYTYSFANDAKNTYYRTQYKLDCIPKANKVFWIHKSENVITGRKFTYTMNIAQVCTGDVVEIAINYYTPRGLINIKSISWEDIEMEMTPPNDFLTAASMNTSRGATPDYTKGAMMKTKVDLNRICELETMGSEWYDSKYYSMSEVFCDMKEISQNFIVESVEFASLDVKACKMKLTAYKVGSVNKELMGIPVCIRPYGADCINEAKRLGLMIDREGDVQLRTGDTLLLYLSKHHQE